jgi:hypothetical protein
MITEQAVDWYCTCLVALGSALLQCCCMPTAVATLIFSVLRGCARHAASSLPLRLVVVAFTPLPCHRPAGIINRSQAGPARQPTTTPGCWGF